MQIRPLVPGIATEVRDVDLAADLDASAWREIEAAWQAHHGLVFRGQDALPVEAQVRLIERFGPALQEREPGQFHSYVTNTVGEGGGVDDMYDGYREGALTPHMDFTYTRHPADAISLYAEAIPEGGTQTRFYSNSLPLARMSRERRAQLASHRIRCVLDLEDLQEDIVRYEAPPTEGRASVQHHEWPLVREHPRKPGHFVLFCTLQQTECVVGVPREESRALLRELFDQHLYVAGNCYVHEWRAGDLLVWDNLALQHGRERTPLLAGARTLRRVAVCADGNGVQETVEFMGLDDTSQAFA